MLKLLLEWSAAKRLERKRRIDTLVDVVTGAQARAAEEERRKAVRKILWHKCPPAAGVITYNKNSPSGALPKRTHSTLESRF